MKKKKRNRSGETAKTSAETGLDLELKKLKALFVKTKEARRKKHRPDLVSDMSTKELTDDDIVKLFEAFEAFKTRAETHVKTKDDYKTTWDDTISNIIELAVDDFICLYPHFTIEHNGETAGSYELLNKLNDALEPLIKHRPDIKTQLKATNDSLSGLLKEIPKTLAKEITLEEKIDELVLHLVNAPKITEASEITEILKKSCDTLFNLTCLLETDENKNNLLIQRMYFKLVFALQEKNIKIDFSDGFWDDLKKEEDGTTIFKKYFLEFIYKYHRDLEANIFGFLAARYPFIGISDERNKADLLSDFKQFESFCTATMREPMSDSAIPQSFYDFLSMKCRHTDELSSKCAGESKAELDKTKDMITEAMLALTMTYPKIKTTSEPEEKETQTDIAELKETETEIPKLNIHTASIAFFDNTTGAGAGDSTGASTSDDGSLPDSLPITPKRSLWTDQEPGNKDSDVPADTDKVLNTAFPYIDEGSEALLKAALQAR